MHKIKMSFGARNQSVIRFFVFWTLFWTVTLTLVLNYPYFVDFLSLPVNQAVMVEFGFFTLLVGMGMWTAASFVGAVIRDKSRRSRAATQPVTQLG